MREELEVREIDGGMETIPAVAETADDPLVTAVAGADGVVPAAPKSTIVHWKFGGSRTVSPVTFGSASRSGWKDRLPSTTIPISTPRERSPPSMRATGALLAASTVTWAEAVLVAVARSRRLPPAVVGSSNSTCRLI